MTNDTSKPTTDNLLDRGFSARAIEALLRMRTTSDRPAIDTQASGDWKVQLEVTLAGLDVQSEGTITPVMPPDPYKGLDAQVYYAIRRTTLCGHPNDQRYIDGYWYRRCQVNGMVWRLQPEWVRDDSQGGYPVQPYRVVKWVQLGTMDEPLADYER